jgi:HK97 family phage portal protein
VSLLETIARAFLPQPDIQTRALDPTDFDTQLKALQRRNPQPWRAASVKEALGVPAILGAVALISDTVGTLSLQAYRQGSLLSQEETPRLVIRPNPFSTPFVFFRNSAFYKATRGERWWWVAARDIDGVALSLYPVPPWEVTVEANDRQPLRPTIRWRNAIVPNEDMIHDMYLPDQTGLRGQGPLQLCGAAISVSVESQEWAANFFASGGLPPALIKSAVKLTEEEAQDLKLQWSESDNNVPKVIDPMIEGVEQLKWDQQATQFNDARNFQVGEVARMFSMPGELIEYQMGGSSLTYKNEEGIWSDFARRCLSPHYLEPMEQDVSDLLTRASVARFNLDQLQRADIQTRYQAWKIGIESGFLSVDEVRQREGLAPGNVDFAPVPAALPQAIPSRLPIQEQRTRLEEWRCENCGRKIAEARGFETAIRCRCGTVNLGHPIQARIEDPRPAPSINVTIAEGAVQVTPPNIETHVHVPPPAKPTGTRTTLERDEDGLIRIIDKEPISEAS